jgi:hypothetical protein
MQRYADMVKETDGELIAGDDIDQAGYFSSDVRR